jgi:hypothetical protein
LLEQKVAQKVANILGYFTLSKNHNKPPKVAQLAKNRQSGHPAKNLPLDLGNIKYFSGGISGLTRKN